MPACAWKVSGGSLAWSRDCSRSFAAEPAPPATAPLMNSTFGYLSARVATRPSRPAFSPPEVFTWWTSGGEKAGLDGLVATLADKYPNVEFINGAVAGGAGSAAKDL